MTFQEQIRQDLAPLLNNRAYEVLESGGDISPESPSYVVLQIDNVGFQIAKDELGTLIIRLYPVTRPWQRWPADYLRWLIEPPKKIPVTLSNRSIREWCDWLVGSFAAINDAFNETRLPKTLLEIEKIATVHRQKFNVAFANDPSILDGR